MPRGAKYKHRETNAQTIASSTWSASRITNEYERAAKMARGRLERLKNAGYEASEFYQEHKDDFQGLQGIGRMNYAKQLAEINRFLNADSSTVGGIQRARENLIDAMNRLYGVVDAEGNVSGPFGEHNIDAFSKFMNKWRAKKGGQMPPSDKLVDIFLTKERLRLNEQDLMHNLKMFLDNEELLNEMSVGDVLGRRKDRGRTFKLSSYLKAAGR